MGRKKNLEPKEEKSFSVVEEGEEIVKKLCEKYPEVLWAVEPQSVGVYGCDNQEAPASCNTLAKIRKVNGVLKAVLEKNNIPLKYIIELYWSDWREWGMPTKQWILFHELCHILDPDAKGLRKHNIEDFSLTLDIVGINGYKQENLPNLLGDKPVEFDKRIVAAMMKPVEDKAEEAPTPPE
jgi:predicted metallopeptidase